MIKFGSPRYAYDLNELATWCKAADAAGLDMIGYGDSATLWYDPFVALTIAAQNTTRARLATTVTNPVIRHPAVMASGFAGLQAVSSGRAVMGIGGGDSAIYNLGLRPGTLATLESYVQAVRGLTEGREVDWQGKKLKLQWPVQRVPAFIAAEGPKTMDLAGRIGDGVILGNGLTEDVVRDSIRRIHAGAVAAGRDPASVEIWWMVRYLVTRTEEEGWRSLAFTLASAANHALRFTMEGKFVPEDVQPRVLALQAAYAQHQHADYRNPGHNAALVEKHGLLEFLGRRFSVCGPSEQIVERLRLMASWGATNFMMIQLVPDRMAALRQLETEIMAKLR